MCPLRVHFSEFSYTHRRTQTPKLYEITDRFTNSTLYNSLLSYYKDVVEIPQLFN